MKYLPQVQFITILLLSALLSSTLRAQAPKPMSLQQTLRESHWKKRVLLLAAPNAQQADFKQQQALLASQQAALAERDFLVLPVLYEQLSAADTQFLTREIGIKLPAFAVVLIGKDGGVKERSNRPIQPENLFGTVDKMPMRRQEMLKK
ncbi:DUF4174 domain-containing protein [Hymenobacter sp. 5317J-9]|uniref:DUF4174 domain-containing protein n=1 Tax=Hymenobacter sp. 5317J-9 TaxID=2932250 RepID=UPI001FD6DB5F|nr:DUF4174 domain-containing protein [Hymenobacter sp. 5317J-9]UOQ96825.1 DUF4174 domain-containing protein [Hymenobacter sp. 5317J-9]